MDAQDQRACPVPRIVDVAILLALVSLSAWPGWAQINATFVDNPKLEHIIPQAVPLAWAAWVASGIQIASVFIWRRFPISSWIAAAAGVAVHVVVLSALARLATHPPGFAPLVPSDLTALLFMYGCVIWRGRKISGLLFAVSIGLSVIAVAAEAAPPAILIGALLIALTTAAFVGGIATRNRNELVASIMARAHDLELARSRDAQLAVIAERSRLSREVHDTVAHALGVIVIQAQAAVAVQNSRADETRTALQAIVTVGRTALADMRDLLTSDPDAAHSQRPLGIADVTALVEQVERAGRAVKLDLAQIPASIPSILEHSIFRIVQEAITNSLKHAAPDAEIEVSIVGGESGIDIVVRDSGGTPSKPSSPGSGLGLRGMRERVALLHGEFAAQADDRGYTVRVNLPSDRLSA